MFLRFLVIVLFTCIGMTGFGQTKSNADAERVLHLEQKVLELRETNTRLAVEIEGVNKRIDDWYTNLAIGGGIFVVILSILIALQWISTRNVARNIAEEELKSLKDQITKLRAEAGNLEVSFGSLSSTLDTLYLKP